MQRQVAGDEAIIAYLIRRRTPRGDVGEGGDNAALESSMRILQIRGIIEIDNRPLSVGEHICQR